MCGPDLLAPGLRGEAEEAATRAEELKKKLEETEAAAGAATERAQELEAKVGRGLEFRGYSVQDLF